MNGSKKTAVKRTVQGRTTALDNEVKQDLAKIFDSAMDTVDDYEEDDVSGREIRRSASVWSEKINYALGELPNDHPLKKNGKIQKLVNKLESIASKPDSEVTYDVMVAGGKPPSVSKQRFWDPIARLIADAQVDVIKPSTNAEAETYVEPKPAFAPSRQSNLTKDNPKVDNIPVKPKLVINRKPKETEKPFTREVPKELRQDRNVEDYIKPDFIVNQVLTTAINGVKKMSDAADIYEEITNTIHLADAEAIANRQAIADLIEIIRGKASFAASKIKPGSGSEIQINTKVAKEIENAYEGLFQYLEGITTNLNHATHLYSDLRGDLKPGEDIAWDKSLSSTFKISDELVNIHDQMSLEDIRNDIVTSSGVDTLADEVERFLKLFYDGHTIDKIVQGVRAEKDHYQRMGNAYTDLISIGRDKAVYNDFMKILGDKRDSKSIRLAVEQYVIEAYTK